MTEKIKISISLDDIVQGKPGTAEYCPIALSIKKMGYEFVSVDTDIICFQKGNKDYYSKIVPDIAKEFIEIFDEDNSDWEDIIKPFEFELEVLVETIEN